MLLTAVQVGVLRAQQQSCVVHSVIIVFILLPFIPVSGGYSEWGDWTNCTANCGSGEQFRTRTCTNPVPEFGGNDCTLIGESTEKRECNKVPCPGILSLCLYQPKKSFEE